jgi:hypothetical protein
MRHTIAVALQSQPDGGFILKLPRFSENIENKVFTFSKMWKNKSLVSKVSIFFTST